MGLKESLTVENINSIKKVLKPGATWQDGIDFQERVEVAKTFINLGTKISGEIFLKLVKVRKSVWENIEEDILREQISE